MWYKFASLRLLLVLAASVAVMAAFACAADTADTTDEPAAKADEPAATTEEPAAKADEPAATTEEPAATEEEAMEEEVAKTEEPAATEEEPAAKEEEAMSGEVTAATYVAPEQSPDVYYKATWQGVRPTTFQENPVFTQWAEDGVQDNGFGWKMEPLAERLPVASDVMIIQPADEIGVYGGTWRLSLSGWLLDLRQYTDGGCLKTDADRATMIAYGCKEWKTSDDGRVWSFRLREGHKWSDGAPLDMEVVRFTFEDMNAYVGEGRFPRKGHGSFEDPVTGKLATWEAIDDLWFSLTFDSPYYNFKEGDSAFWASRCDRYCFFAHPSMKEMHEDYQDADVLAKMVKDAGVDNWVTLIRKRASYFDYQDSPYPNNSSVYQSGGHGAAPSQQLMASPYHFAVDPVGNQLPYFDSITATNFESREVAVFRSMAGETDADAHQFELPEMPLYLANMVKGDYSIFHQVNGNGADSGLGFNTTFNDDKEIGMAMRTRKFRRAWSTALDREGMNEVAFLGLGTPQQIVPHPSNRYYPGPEWAQLDAENDPAKSIKLLGEAGWTDTDNDGFINRQDPFGTGDTGNLDLFMEIPIGGHVGDRALSQTDMIVAGVKDAGIKLDFTAKQGASVSDNKTYVGFGGSATINPWQGTGFGFPKHKSQSYASLIGLYWESQGQEGMGPTGPDPDFLPLSPAGRAPADTSGLMLDNQTIWKQGTGVPRSSPERTEWGKEIWRNINTAKWELGIVAFSGANLGVMIKRNNFRNVARSQGPTRVGEFAEQYYFEDGLDNKNNPGNKSKKYKSVSFLTDDVYTRPEVR